MPLLLHPHLKRGLVYDEPDTDPADAIEHAPRRQIDPEEQAAKRQRIAEVASQYLRGRMPVIMTASLRGPFNHGWKNPWAEDKKPKRKPRACGVPRHKAGSSAHIGVGRAAQEPTRPTRSASRTIAEAHTIASPETSRAADTVEDHQESHTLDVIGPATAPSPPEQASSTANSYSAETTRCVRSRSPMTNPFWLRRPDSDRAFDKRRFTNGTAEDSPSHARGTLPQPDIRRTLELAQPKAVLGHRAQQQSVTPANHICSSASASMAISSPANLITQVGVEHDRSLTLQQQETPAATTGPSPSTLDNAQLQSASNTMPACTPLTGPGSVPAELEKSPGTSQQGSQEPLSREVIQHSGEDLVGLVELASSSATLSKQTNEDAVRGTNEGSVSEALPRRIQHNLVASPALNSSSGFVYKKVGTKKWTLNNAPRSKPRAVNFNSSPANKGGARSKPNSQNSKKSEVDRPDEALDGAREVLDEQQSMGSTRSSGQSAMSTQAAMILAQLEFQESTFPTSSVDSSRPWSQSQEATPRPVLPEPSPAITPLSVFRPQLDQGHVMTSVLQGPMMSTQDLFAAASPFAMSTIKKKSAVPEGERSYLGTFTTSSTGQDDDASDLSSRSPMSLRNQIQQAEKKAAPSPRSFGYDKGPRKSQCSSEEHTRYSISDVELPQLDLKTSLDGYGSNGSVHFADRFLRTFNDT